MGLHFVASSGNCSASTKFYAETKTGGLETKTKISSFKTNSKTKTADSYGLKTKTRFDTRMARSLHYSLVQ